MRVDAESNKVFHELFCTSDIDPKAELKLDLLCATRPIIKKFQMQVDSDVRKKDYSDEYVEQADIYTT